MTTTEAAPTIQAEFPATVFSGGRLTIPASLRKLLGVSPGTKLKFVADGKTIRVVIKSTQQAVPGSLT